MTSRHIEKDRVSIVFKAMLTLFSRKAMETKNYTSPYFLNMIRTTMLRIFIFNFLSIVVSYAATTNVNITSPLGTTNIVRDFISGTLGEGKLLVVSGTNIVGFSTNSFAGTNALVTFNSTQFTTNGNVISIRNVPVTTNITDAGTVTASTLQGNTLYTDNAFLTNLFIYTVTANTILKADGSKSVESVTSGTGLLYDDGSGNFSWITNYSPYYGYRDILAETNTWTGTNNFTGILSQGGVNVLTNIPGSGLDNTLTKWLTTNSQSYIANGIGMLTNDGAGSFGFTTNLTQDVTINNVTATNINSQTINIETNIFIVGKGGSVTITNALSLTSLGTNMLLRMGADGVVTNIANASGVLTNDGSGGFSWTTNVGSSGGGSVTVNGTNVATPNFTNTSTVSYSISGATNILAATSTNYDTINVTTANIGTINLTNRLSPSLVDINTYSAYASGTAYTLSTTYTNLDFGTTDTTMTIAVAGTYLIHANASVKYVAATYAGAQTVTLKIRRTNNTPADVANATRTITLPVLTAFTGGDTIVMPPVFYAATAGDIVEFFGSYSAAPSAGSVTAESAEIVAFHIQ